MGNFDNNGGFRFFFLFLLLSFSIFLRSGFMFQLMHVSFRHTNHDKISKDVEEKDGHTDEEEGGHIGIDKGRKLSSDETEIRVENKMVDRQLCIEDVVKIDEIVLIPLFSWNLCIHFNTFLTIGTLIGRRSTITTIYIGIVDCWTTEIGGWTWI